MTGTVADWLTVIEHRWPTSTAASWDATGLQVGDPAWLVERVLVALDVTGAVVAEAAEVPATLLLAHHPLLFRPLDRLTPDTASGATALAAARAGVAVAAAHTNLDVAADGAGTSDPVVRVLGLRDVRPLSSAGRQGRRLKLVTFVPPESIDAVLDAVSLAGAGSIGEYERCSFRVLGTGTFRPGSGAQPHSGEVDTDNTVEEIRLEVELPSRRSPSVVRALLDAHPYEEVAYDLYPLVDHAHLGIGRVGILPQPTLLRDVAEQIRRNLPAPDLRYAGDPDRAVSTVAVVGGAGDSLVDDALAAGVDVFVTGDLRHHVTLDALELGLALVDAGHHATEAAALPAWIEALRGAGRAHGLTAPVVASVTSTAPWSG